MVTLLGLKYETHFTSMFKLPLDTTPRDRNIIKQMYSFVPHSHAISILLMLLLWIKFVSWDFLDFFLYWVLPSIMSFCVSDQFVCSSCSWTKKKLSDIGCLCIHFDLMVYSISIISLMETKYPGISTLQYKPFGFLIYNMGSFWMPYIRQTWFLFVGLFW